MSELGLWQRFLSRLVLPTWILHKLILIVAPILAIIYTVLLLFNTAFGVVPTLTYITSILTVSSITALLILTFAMRLLAYLSKYHNIHSTRDCKKGNHRWARSSKGNDGNEATMKRCVTCEEERELEQTESVVSCNWCGDETTTKQDTDTVWCGEECRRKGLEEKQRENGQPGLDTYG